MAIGPTLTGAAKAGKVAEKVSIKATGAITREKVVAAAKAAGKTLVKSFREEASGRNSQKIEAKSKPMPKDKGWLSKEERSSMPPMGKPRMVRKPRITAGDLLKRTLLDRRQASKQVAVVKVDRIKIPSPIKAWKGGFRIRLQNKENGKRYTAHVFCEDVNVKSESKVIVQCSCQDFVFTWEVANAEKGGCSFIYRSNGERPDQKNPGMRIGLCKHGYLALRYLSRSRIPVEKE